MLRILLKIQGRKCRRQYKIVVKDANRRCNVLAEIGYYDPFIKSFKLDYEAFERFREQGAQVTEGLQKLIAVYQ
jgi:ribosomal protein S16